MKFFNNVKVIDNKQAVVNALNDYFINIGHESMQNISNTNVNSFKTFQYHRNNNSMFLFHKTEERSIDAVNKSKRK